MSEQALDTFPKLLRRNAERFGNRPALREKNFGIWQTWTWSQMLAEVRLFACGLAARGFRRGDSLVIIGDNRPRLYWGLTAAQCLGGIPVPAYQDAAATELQYVLEHAEARFVLAEDQEQVDKVFEVRGHCPALEEIIYDDRRGLRHYDQRHLHDFEAIQAEGRRFGEAQPAFFDQQVDSGRGSDTSIILYTSGTTGRPKGVVLSHDNMVITARHGNTFDHLSEKEEVLAYLPMAWVGDHLFSYAQAYLAGYCVNCPESPATVMDDMRDIGPTFFFAPPRIFENLLTQVYIRMEDSARIKQTLFHYFMAVAKRSGTAILRGAEVALLDRIKYRLGELLIYGPLKDTMGMSRIRLAYTAGEAIGPDIFDFYRSLGINIKQLYGQTEATVNVTLQPDGEVYPDTVGKPAPEVEIRITEVGEVLYRSPGVFQHYHKNEEATREVKSADGWVRTGDAGFFDANGHLKIIDRVKDVGRLNDGSMFAPKYIENKVKFFPHIREAVAIGHQRDYCTIIVNIDLEAVGNWAERHAIPYSSYQELAARPEVYDLVQESLEKVNVDLAGDEKLAASQLRRFLILHKELDADDGELTRTRKVRRGVIAERYREVIDALYGGRSSCHVEIRVSYEDGRSGTLAGDLLIRDLVTVAMDAPLRKVS